MPCSLGRRMGGVWSFRAWRSIAQTVVELLLIIGVVRLTHGGQLVLYPFGPRGLTLGESMFATSVRLFVAVPSIGFFA